MKPGWPTFSDLVFVFLVLTFGILALLERFTGDTLSAIWFLLLAMWVVVCTQGRGR